MLSLLSDFQTIKNERNYALNWRLLVIVCIPLKLCAQHTSNFSCLYGSGHRE